MAELSQAPAPQQRSHSTRGKESAEVYMCCNNRYKFHCGWAWAVIFFVIFTGLFGVASYYLFLYRNVYYYSYSVGSRDGYPVTFFFQTVKAVADYSKYLRGPNTDDQVAFLDTGNCGRGARATTKDAMIYLSTPGHEDDSEEGIHCDREFDDAVAPYYNDVVVTTAHVGCRNDTLGKNVTDALECLFEAYFEEEGQNYCPVSDYGKLIADSSYDKESCGISSKNEQGCAPGFYQPNTDSADGVPAAYRAARPCEPGFFCPENFNCMFPCLWGSACLRSTPVRHPNTSTTCEFPYHLDKNEVDATSVYNNSVNWCSANRIDAKRDLCPGAQGVSLCPAGYFCPNPTSVRECPKGYYCPQGSYEPKVCDLKFICNSRKLDYPPILLLIVEIGIGVLCGAALLWKLAHLVHVYVRDKRRGKQLEHIQQRALAREVASAEAESVERETMQVAAVAEGEDERVGVCCGISFITHGTVLVASTLILIMAIVLIAVGATSGSNGAMLGVGILFLILDLAPLILSIVGIVRILAASGQTLLGALRLERKHAVLISESRRASVQGHLATVDALGSIKAKTSTRVNIEVQELGLKLHSNGAMVLAGVNGKLDSGKVTALMGPSGAGKTTFLNTLSGRATYGDVTGKVLLNGEQREIDSIGSIVGFVPQEDTMHRELTVREILKFYARLRLPRHFTKEVQERVVEDVVEALGLIHIVDSAIGDEAKRGISGGQRKRVNVGMEMVSDPSLLFLDEPTSGLDSTTSYELVSALSQLAAKGLNVIAVLHQPSFQLYAMFDNVLLLGNGGRTVYLGDSDGALGYFQSLAFELPYMMNPADFFMDVIAGKMERKGFPDFHKTDLFDLWDERRGKYEELAAKSFVPADPIRREDILANEGAGILTSTWIFFHRSVVQYTKTGDANVFDVLLCLFTGLFLGLSYPNVTLATSANSFLMFSFGLGLDIGLSTLRVFGDAKVVFWREASPGAGMGLSPLSYFIAKTLVELPRLFILTAVNVACFLAFAEPECDFSSILGFAYAFSWAISGYATLFSIAMDEKSAQLLLVIILLVFLLYGGIQTLLSSMSKEEFKFSMLSPNRWLVEDMVVCNSAALSASYRLPYTFYVSVKDSVFAVLFGLSYSEEVLYPAQTPQDTRDFLALFPWFLSSDNEELPIFNTTNTGIYLPSNRDGVDLNSLINFWLGLTLRILSYLVMRSTNREKMGKESYSALFKRRVLHPIFDWLVAIETKAVASLSPHEEQVNPVHSMPKKMDNARHNDEEFSPVKEAAGSAEKTRSGSTVEGADNV